ncbi:hypothetical protein BD626DRAFT_501962 [Schizophyllum amplum]|uniref:RING-type E3 ubiquitin transferase n=1 Tax=Schizophyllum amplum TaxID=97359 RepID=A0A550C8Z2_9AGAR|nr:hypothetical protein BD626DRAFT_501962 [Auriculariopsis ampla]
MASTQTQTQTNVNGGGAKQGGKRNRGRGGQKHKKQTAEGTGNDEQPLQNTAETTNPPAVDDEELDSDAPVCFICAEPVKYYAVSSCNHRTCHVCSLRLRALYKKTDCTFCKEPQSAVIFTVSPEAPFLSFTPDAIPYKDARLAISCETQEMLEESLILLRFNCPDDSCDYIGKGWADLKLHARATHGKLMCDLCIRSKKVFSHEHVLYPPNVLPMHLPSMYHKMSQRSVPKEQVEGGIHPMCDFCHECFFSDDELYQHMRQSHEECFVCKRNEIQHQYFKNYESLERHFSDDHYPCHQTECQARKFVVFGSALDLQAHMVDEHGSTMSAKDIKDARRVQTGFDFEEVPGAGGRRRGQKERDRPREAQSQPAAGPSRPSRRQGFSGSLTVDGSTPNNPTPPPAHRQASPPRADIDAATLARHQELMNRINAYAANPSHAVPAVKFAIRSYRATESSARDLISTVWNVLDNHLEHTASIISGFIDILDDDEKRQDLLSSWKGFEVEQKRQFPDLVPSAVGSGYAAVSSGRVLNAKQSTAAQHSSRQVLDRVAQAASSSAPRAPPPRHVPGAPRRHVPGSAPPPSRAPDIFPSLQQTTGASPSRPASGNGQRPTPWSASAAGKVRSVPGPGASIPAPRRANGNAPPKLSKEGFPELRGAGSGRGQRPQVSGNVSLKNILGGSGAPAVSAWAAGGSGGGGDSAPGSGTATPVGEQEDAQEESGAGGGGGKKKGKGKQKQTLFKLGAFPA